MKYLVTGGCRSGKTDFGSSLLGEGEKFYLATAYVGDVEMKRRVQRHQQQRSHEWITIEAQENLPQALQSLPANSKALVDSLSMWLANIMSQHQGAYWIEPFDHLLEAVNNCEAQLVLISDETGLGLISPNPVGRRFCDLNGMMNQKVAQLCDQVLFVACGLPLRLK